ncbi:putative F-box protein At1g65770 [Quercus robur]|uniref:putative F-box protein At1g65770 n=1 Tax=Quercus robur TaxID=38942 RepID=UPI002162C5A7|nr:putative F-box protein At1g65770 [Quercus robur]XP_050241624.1 putative F-box protein At1g65770 [Quercus robur]
MDEREVDWSALPVELLLLIGKSIQSRIGVVRFRSVCASLRSSIPPPCEILPPFPLPLPFTGSAGRAFVSHRTFYRFKLPDDVNPNPSTCSSKSWLIKVEEFEFGRKCLLNPLPNLYFGFPFPKGINLLDYQVVEVSKEYELQSISGMPIVGVDKLVLFPDSAWNSSVKDTVIYALFHEGKLGYMKYGDQNWTLVDDLCHYDDIIVYNGKPYVVDNWGLVSWIDSSMKLIEFSPLLPNFGNQKHLVESRGELYVVDRFFDTQRRLHHLPKTFTFDVYKLDQECGRWVTVENLGDRVFILGKDSSFSVSATEFSGCKGNCIYFTYKDDNGVFDQKTCKIVDFQDWSHLFRLPPSWLNSKSSSKC